MAFNRPFLNSCVQSYRMLYYVQITTCETDIFSFRIKAENLSHVTTFELPSSYASQLSFASFCGNGNLLQLIFLDCRMLFWLAHEGILIMILKSTDMTKLLTGTRKIHCSVQPVPLFIQGCQPICIMKFPDFFSDVSLTLPDQTCKN